MKILIILILANSIDFFGFNEYSAARSQDYTIAILLGHMHADRAGRMETEGQTTPATESDCNGTDPGDCVAVVLFNEEALGYFDVDWPIPHYVHGRLLKKLLSYEPKAVLVDFLFIDSRDPNPGVDEKLDSYFPKVIRQYDCRGIPLYFVGNNLDRGKAVSTAWLGNFFDRQGNQTLGDDGRPRFENIRVAWAPLNLNHGVARYYRSHIARATPEREPPSDRVLQLDRGAGTQPDSGAKTARLPPCPDDGSAQNSKTAEVHANRAGGKPTARSGTLQLTAAFQIWQDICLAENPREDCSWPEEDENISLGLIYGTRVHPVNSRWMDTKAADGATLIDCRDTVSLPIRFLLALFNSDYLWSNCPYIGEIPVQELDQPYDEDIASLVKGKIVVYGAKLAGLGDVYQTPTHKLQPGARVHAAALDNLFLYGPKGFKRVYDSDFLTVTELGHTTFDHTKFRHWLYYFSVGIAVNSIVVWIFMAVFEGLNHLIVAYWCGDFSAKTKNRIRVFSKAIAIVLSTIAILIINMILYRSFNILPVNWIAMFFGLTVSSWLYQEAEVDRPISSSPHPSANPPTSKGESR